ncbi:MAG: hypothetical protein ABWZ26_00310 [Candidatus Nanopelagicales bacterium]
MSDVLVEVSGVDAEPGAPGEMSEYARALLDPSSDAVDEPERVLLDALAREQGVDPALLQLPLVADLVSLAMLTRARGACVNVDGHVRVTGVPPRPDGWLIDLADGRQLGVIEGGIAELATPLAERVVAIAPSAYEAALVTRRPAVAAIEDGAEVWRRVASGAVTSTPGFAAFIRSSRD